MLWWFFEGRYVEQAHVGVEEIYTKTAAAIKLKHARPDLALEIDHIWDQSRLIPAWAETFCKVPLEEIIETAERLNNLCPGGERRMGLE